MSGMQEAMSLTLFENCCYLNGENKIVLINQRYILSGVTLTRIHYIIAEPEPSFYDINKHLMLGPMDGKCKKPPQI